MTVQRIQQDLLEISRKPPALCTAGPIDDNMFEWNATMIGPKGTPYEGGHFHLRIQFPSNYPTKPPNINFVTKIFHPNISEDGVICSSLLQSFWTPIWTIADLLSAISGFLSDPNPDSPHNEEAATLYKNDRSQFNDKAREWTHQFADADSN